MPSAFTPWLNERAAREGERSALRLASRQSAASTLSFARLDQYSDSLATGLLAQGLERGDRIAIWLPNGPLWLAFHFAAAKAGLTTIPLNTWYKQAEVTHFLALSRARALVIDSSFHAIPFAMILGETVRTGRCPDLQSVWDVAGAHGELPGVRWSDLASLASDQGSRPASGLAPDQPAIVFATSGTTALPKLAMHGEAALLAHGGAVAARAGLTPDDVVLGTLPPCGAYGYTLLLASLSAGAQAVLLDRADIDHMIEVIERDRVTVMAITEPIIRALLDHPRATPASLQSLRLVFSAGGTLREVVERAERQFGFRVSNVYGSSEVLALAAFWAQDTSIETRSEAGGEIVSQGMTVAAFGEDDAPLPTGEAGELRFRGPIVTQGYLENPTASAAAFADGWYRSGDLGFSDGGGRFRYIARMNDALRIKGFLVNPGEVETMLIAHPAVAAAQVVGLADGRGEDLAVAFVVLREGHAADADELRGYCRGAMASYKTPAAIRILPEFPTTRSANGDKVVKNTLREMARELMSNA